MYRLKGPRGLMILESWFSDMKFKGKGHEKEDLDALMCRLELWTHRLFPKFTFDDCLNRIEKLGHKKPVMVIKVPLFCICGVFNISLIRVFNFSELCEKNKIGYGRWC